MPTAFALPVCTQVQKALSPRLFFCYNEQEKREKGMRKMKIVLLHGLGQHPQSWQAVQDSLEGAEIDCPDLFALTEGEPTYAAVLAAR